MNQVKIDIIQTNCIEICLLAHAHMVLLGQLGKPYRDYAAVADLIRRVVMEVDPTSPSEVVILPELGELLDMVQQQEELTMTDYPARTEDLERLSNQFDFALEALSMQFHDQLQSARSPIARQVDRALADKGILTQVIALTKRSLSERIHERKQRRRWHSHLRRKSLPQGKSAASSSTPPHRS